MSKLPKCLALRRGEEAKRPSYSVIDEEESLWSLDEEDDAQGQPVKVLMITLVKPPLSEDEIRWKKGEDPSICLNV